MKKMVLANIAVLACIWLFCSCRNISAQDFGPDDIANILKVVMSGEAYIPETSDLPEPLEPESEAPATEAARDETRETENPVEPTSPERETETETSPPTTAAPTTEPTTERLQETTNPYYESGGATLINIRDIFPEAPEKFWNIAYPEAVPMLDSLKKSLKSLAGFSARDFGGFTFYIATTEPKLFKPDYGGGALSDARRYRTEAVQVECNTLIRIIETPKEAIVEDIRRYMLADEIYSDILCVPFRVQSELIREGFAVNLKKIPFLNLNADYYNASATEAFTVNGNVFGLVSDLTFDPSAVYAMFYNKELVRRYNLTSPLAVYKNGGWNWDAVFSASKELAAAKADLDGGTVYSVGLDKESGDAVNGLFISSGNKYFTKRDYGYPIMNFSNDKTTRLIEALANIFSPPEGSGVENYLAGGDAAQQKAFAGGNVLFSVARLEMLPDITDSKFDWGILPVPSPETGYGNRYSFTSSDALCISILRTTRNAEACGIVIGALSVASRGQLGEIYTREQMTFHLRDVDSVVILGEIVGNLAFNQYNAFVTTPEMTGATVGVIKDAANKKGDFPELYEKGRKNLNDFFAGSPPFLLRS